jgi:hypothetical protein
VGSTCQREERGGSVPLQERARVGRGLVLRLGRNGSLRPFLNFPFIPSFSFSVLKIFYHFLQNSFKITQTKSGNFLKKTTQLF